MEDQRWQGRLLWTGREDYLLSEHSSFAWLSEGAVTPTHTIARVMELYEQLLSTQVYTAFKTGILQTKLAPCVECAVRYQKALLTFWRDVHR